MALRRFSVLAILLVAFTACLAAVHDSGSPPGAPQPACPPAGIGGDPALNVQKNRTTASGNLRDVSFDDVLGLNAKAVNKKLRSNWTRAEQQSVEAVENGDRLQVTGILVDAKLSPAETCNCSSPEPASRDFHIWIARDRRSAAPRQSFVVEMTPRVRASHPGWTLKKLRALIPPKRWTLVRIAGLATYDNEHWNYPRDNMRATVWEIHPVFQFWVCSRQLSCDPTQPNGWTLLDDLPEPRRVARKIAAGRFPSALPRYYIYMLSIFTESPAHRLKHGAQF